MKGRKGRIFGSRDPRGESGLRLPQDAALDPSLGVPDLRRFAIDVDAAARRYHAAVSAGDFEGRALALWALVAAGPRSVVHVAAWLSSNDEQRVEDAAGVLQWIGVRDDTVGTLEALTDRLPDGTARDSVLAALPAGVRARRDGDVDRSERSDPGVVPLGGAMDPFTERIWFIDAPLPVVQDELQGWYAERDAKWVSSSIEGGLAGLLSHLEPWQMPSPGYVLTETDGAWTACFSQGSDISVVFVLGDRLGVRAVGSGHAPHVVRDGRIRRYGFTELRVEDSRRDAQRTVHLSRQDSGWAFELSGTPFEFEEIDRYDARENRDRFGLAQLNRYLGHLGIDRSDPAFYGPHGVLITEHWTTRGVEPRKMPSAEWRREHS